MKINEVKQEIFKKIMNLVDDKTIAPVDDMPLIGSDSALDSMKLVELCLILEDMATELGFEFDWTSDSAMSRSRSMFRTAGSISAEFISQMEAKK
jgi:hypothetical protein